MWIFGACQFGGTVQLMPSITDTWNSNLLQSLNCIFVIKKSYPHTWRRLFYSVSLYKNYLRDKKNTLQNISYDILSITNTAALCAFYCSLSCTRIVVNKNRRKIQCCLPAGSNDLALMENSLAAIMVLDQKDILSKKQIAHQYRSNHAN